MNPAYSILTKIVEADAPKKKDKPKDATFLIRIPNRKVHVKIDVRESLSYWNTHYKHRHQWDGGRIETRFDPKVKGYDAEGVDYLDFGCPHCKKRLYFRPAAVHGVKGDIRCSHCKGQFAVQPSGMIGVPVSVDRNVTDSEADVEGVKGWLKSNTNYLEVYVNPYNKGDESIEVEVEGKDVAEFRAELKSSRYQYTEER